MSCQCIQLETIVERNQEIDASDLDGEKVMMDMDRGNYFMLNPIGSRIWDLINEPISVRRLVSLLREEYDVSEDECLEGVKDFLHELHHSNLLNIH